MTRQETMDYLCGIGMLTMKIENFKEEISFMDGLSETLFRKTYQRKVFPPVFLYFGVIIRDLFICLVLLSIEQWIVLGTLRKTFPTLSAVSFISILVLGVHLLMQIGLFVFLFTHMSGYNRFRQYLKDKKEDNLSAIAFEKSQDEFVANIPAYTQLIKEQIDWLQSLLAEAEEKLEGAYNLNFLYDKYRRVDIVAKLYEYFLSGSVDTLKEAINKYDQESRLDTISEKLDNVITISQDIYAEMQKQTLLLEDNNRLAKQQLEFARATEKNTRVTAENTRNIARNTAITAFNTGLLVFYEREREYRRIHKGSLMSDLI